MEVDNSSVRERDEGIPRRTELLVPVITATASLIGALAALITALRG